MAMVMSDDAASVWVGLGGCSWQDGRKAGSREGGRLCSRGCSTDVWRAEEGEMR